MSQESRSGLAELQEPRSTSRGAAVRKLVRAAVIWRREWGGSFASRVAPHLHGKLAQVLTGDLSSSMCVPLRMAWGSQWHGKQLPWERDQEWGAQTPCGWCDLSSEVTHRHFRGALLVAHSDPICCGSWLHKGSSARRQNHWDHLLDWRPEDP